MRIGRLARPEGAFAPTIVRCPPGKGRVVGREIPILRAEIPLQLDGIARRQRHHGLQPEGGGYETCAPLISPKEPRISVAPFSTSRPRIRAEVLELTL